MSEITLRESIEVPRTVADCYRYVSDFSTIEQWDPSVLSARKLTPGPVREGSAFSLRLRNFGRESEMDYQLVECAAPAFLRLRGIGGGVHAEDRISFIALSGTRTRIDYAATLRFDNLSAAALRLLRPALQRMGRNAVEGLRTALTPAVAAPQASAAPTVLQRLVLPAAVPFTHRGYRRMPVKAHSQFLDGQTIVITGPTAGIGLATACELARLGARLVLVGRGADRLERAAEQIVDFAGGARAIRLVEADLADGAQLSRAAATILAMEPRIDTLINNAGALFAERQLTADGHERTFAVNLLAPYRLTTALLPALSQSHGRVINVSSGGQYLQALRQDDLEYARTPFDGVKAYAQAKRALVSLTRAWATRYPQVGFHVMHPGWVATPGVAKSLPAFDRVMQSQLRDPRMGADTIVWLCAAPQASLGSGNFWLDRRTAPYDVLPNTALSDAECDQLLDQLESFVEPAQMKLNECAA